MIGAPSVDQTKASEVFIHDGSNSRETLSGTLQAAFNCTYLHFRTILGCV